MNRKDIAVIALRITALYFFIQALAQLAPFLTTIASLFLPDDSTDIGTEVFILSGGVSLLVYFAAAGGLWHYATKAADLILPNLTEQPSDLKQMNLRDIEVFCISLLGLFILASATPSVTRIIFATILPNLDSAYGKMLVNPYSNERKAIIPYSDIVYLIVKLGIGFWFTFGSAGILGLVKKVRELGRGSNQSPRDGS